MTQLQAALDQVDKGTSLFSNGMSRFVQELYAQESVDGKLNALVHAF